MNIFAVINLLQDKKDEMELLREMKMKGHIVRSPVQGLQHGEKSSKLFCFLENKHFNEKTVKSIKKENSIRDAHIPDKILEVKVTTARSKVKSRSDHDVAHLHPLTNVPTKYQLPTPYGY